ncbi:MAG TPA: hypothetical protein VLA04_05415 [Verrucomicrobiae bacterium]|nr:hypothetical protein [Verrucomicrobiae bacterium]
MSGRATVMILTHLQLRGKAAPRETKEVWPGKWERTMHCVAQQQNDNPLRQEMRAQTIPTATL